MTRHARVTTGSREYSLEYEWISRERSAVAVTRIPARRPRLGRDVARLAAAAVRCRRVSRTCVFAAGLRTLDTAGRSGKVAGRLHAFAGARSVARVSEGRRRRYSTDPPWLLGHSDGASIALLHAAAFPDRVAGVIALAPHVFVEDLSIESIARTRETYLATTDTQGAGLRVKLARYHDDPDSAFWGWNDIWLDPAFRSWNIEAAVDRDHEAGSGSARRR